ncbi:response regulator [Marinibacterium sp. SX1]|uniref:response regulator n=1 Tax=Marinibacterium sp. SX1 TaxID=3388424 RepID=UPI003D18214A
MRSAARYALIALAYVVAWCALDLVGWVFEVSPGISPWYPPHGLSVALLMALGPRFMPLLMIGPLIMGSLVWLPGEPLALVLLALGVTAGYGLAALWLRHRRVDPRLSQLSDVLHFFAAMIVASLAVAVLAILDLAAFGLLAWADVPAAILSFWAGDTLGVVCIAPVLMTLVFPALTRLTGRASTAAPPPVADARRLPTPVAAQGPARTLALPGDTPRATALRFAALAGTILLVLDPFDIFDPSLSFLLIFPILAVAVTGSVTGTALAVALASIGLAISLRTNAALDRLEAEQLLLTGLSIGALCLAAAVAGLRSGRTLLRDIFDTTSEGIVALDRTGRVMMANSASRHMLGGISDPEPFDWPADIRFLDAQDNRPLDGPDSPIARALAGEKIQAETRLMTRKARDGHRYVRISSGTVKDEGATLWVVLAFDDVTREEESRQQIERSGRLDALGQLTGGIAHDFNNLLATIEYSVQLGANADDPATARRYGDAALKAVRKGADLTGRLLAFARRQPGKAQSRPVADVLAEFDQLARPTIEENIALEIDHDDPDLRVFCDTGQLENALLNLVLNARDAITLSGKGGRIVVSARGISEIDADAVLRRESPHSYIVQGLHANGLSPDTARTMAYRYVELAVTDDGPGMSDTIKRRATDPFFTTKETGMGTGLGLSMVYGFVQQSHGELRIYSEPGLGTTIRMIVPRGTEAGHREQPIERLPRPRGKGQRILLVEDQPDLLEMMRDVLVTLGYTVTTARTGADCLALFADGAGWDLLLTDVVMPGGMDGFRLAEEVRARAPDLPVLYMSGYTGHSEDEKGAVPAPILQKPCTPAELAGAISDALSGDDAPAPG